MLLTTQLQLLKISLSDNLRTSLLSPEDFGVKAIQKTSSLIILFRHLEIDYEPDEMLISKNKRNSNRAKIFHSNPIYLNQAICIL